MDLSQETWIFLGASRGFGRSFLEKAIFSSQPPQIFLFSRKASHVPFEIRKFDSDFSRDDQWNGIVQTLKDLNPTRIFYFAGGGPYGKFQDKNWKDHRWALKVSFEFPAFLLHHMLATPGNLKQMTFVGSSVAETNPDPLASSYCAAKQALKGQNAPFDLRLFSPGYMDTELLPRNAWPRQQAGLVKSPEEVAGMLWASIHNADDANEHFVLKSSP